MRKSVDMINKFGTLEKHRGQGSANFACPLSFSRFDREILKRTGEWYRWYAKNVKKDREFFGTGAAQTRYRWPVPCPFPLFMEKSLEGWVKKRMGYCAVPLLPVPNFFLKKITIFPNIINRCYVIIKDVYDINIDNSL